MADPATLAAVLAMLERCSAGRFVDANVIAVYLWGSRVYGTATAASDWDYMCVSNAAWPEEDQLALELQVCKATDVPLARGRARSRGIVFEEGELNVSVVHEHAWRRMVAEHRLEALEALWLPERFVLRNELRDVAAEWKLDRALLRIAGDFEAGRTFNKAKKTSLPEMKRRKETFHAHRYCVMARSIATHGRIVDYGAANEWWPRIRDAPDFSAELFTDSFRMVFHEFHEALGPVLAFQSNVNHYLSFQDFVEDAHVSTPFEFVADCAAGFIASLGSWERVEALGFVARRFRLAGGGATVVHVSGHRVAWSQLVAELAPELARQARQHLCVIYDATRMPLRLLSSSEGVVRACDVAQPQDGLPLFWWRDAAGARMAATHLSPDARELSVDALPVGADVAVSYVSPAARGRFSYGSTQTPAALARFCCVAISTEIEDFVDAVPACEPFFTARLLHDAFRASLVRLCNALAPDARPLEVMAQSWPRLADQLASARVHLLRVVDQVEAAPDPHSLLGRVFIQFGRDAVVARLSVMRPAQYVRAVNLKTRK